MPATAAHHEIEETIFVPFLTAHGAKLGDRIAKSHVQLVATLDSLHERIAGLRKLDKLARPAVIAELNATAKAFVADMCVTSDGGGEGEAAVRRLGKAGPRLPTRVALARPQARTPEGGGGHGHPRVGEPPYAQDGRGAHVHDHQAREAVRRPPGARVDPPRVDRPALPAGLRVEAAPAAALAPP